MSLRLAYGTNGFGDHRLGDALSVISDLGYAGVALTLDHPHLDPLARDAPAQTARARRLLERHGLAVAVETGARYLLDPWHKHEPTLVSDAGRERRTDLLIRAVEIAADLGSEVVSLWSGILPASATPQQGWDRLLTGLAPVLPRAARAGVTLAFEPEPGMFISRLEDVAELRRRLGDPDELRITLDVGHLCCNETATPEQCVRTAGEALAHVQIDDMRRGVHEHLELGDGQVDFPPVLAALQDAGYAGLVAVELPRHGHAAPAVARRSLDALRSAMAAAERLRRENAHHEEALT
ncbi:sugar phosphate isomerase/epimerase [Georgenia yuyongxinii]|uniref:Sugar phosphate isomerase/epimerase n=1 Tax=Georgenia yuyongxinii TaxID=2589797 RepID=A0A5B8C6R3_9MICO|nr:sugar phosphate isomerase/epimerase family protein [Georgenia yuyongxinii]QDC26108.1 sugar phosphate isomerase/epimerase [Georgenia yuyongxinii]